MKNKRKIEFFFFVYFAAVLFFLYVEKKKVHFFKPDGILFFPATTNRGYYSEIFFASIVHIRELCHHCEASNEFVR